MNFVVVSYHFLPKCDAEAFCTTRFASSLAEAGHKVHVVTMDWPDQVSAQVNNFLVSKKLTVTRVKRTAAGRPHLWRRLCYMTDEYGVVDFDDLITTLRHVLISVENPVLISRSSPWASFIAAWHCRSFATKWICHYSDPLSYLPRGGLRAESRYRMARFWIKRCLRHADAISLTCESVKRYYHDNFGSLFDRQNVFVTPHIGDPVLPCEKVDVDRSRGKVIAHIGYLSEGRGARDILATIQKLNDSGTSCRLVQCGPIDPWMREMFSNCPFVEVLSSTDPDYATGLSRSADVVLIADQDTEMGYIPFCPSKFAYQVFSDRPIVALTRPGSAMAVCASTFERSGIYAADYGKITELEVKLREALNSDVKAFDRAKLRQSFSQSQVAENFIANIQRL